MFLPKAVSAELPIFSGYNRKFEVMGSKLRKTYPAGHGSPFAYARIAVNFTSANKSIYPLITIACGILRSNMGC